MLFLAIVATIGAIMWGVFVLYANGMSSSPSQDFQGGLSVAAGFVIALVLWIAWAVG